MRKPIMIRFLCAGMLLSLLTGCGSGTATGTGAGSSEAPSAASVVISPPVLTVTTITVSGSTDTVAAVTVAGRADGDGVADTAFQVALPLDGVVLPIHQPALPYDQSLTITATDGASPTTTRMFTVAIDP